MNSTDTVDGLLEHCDSVEELKNCILPRLKDQREQWRESFSLILEQTGYSLSEMARMCNVSEAAVRKWKNGALPQNRDMYLRIGFAAGMDRKRMDALLRRCGRCPGLYVKNLEDSICLFVLGTDAVPHTYRAYTQVLALVRTGLSEQHASQNGEPGTCSTLQLMDALSEIRRPEEVLEFVQENVTAFAGRYKRFYTFVMAFLNENLCYGAELSSGERRRSFHEIAQEAGWSSSLRHCLYEIRRRTWFPQRMKVISLGLHLNMDVDSVNDLLRLAYMEPLYTRNPIEAAVMWGITDFQLGCEDGCIARDGSGELCAHVKGILETLELAESEGFIDDL